MYLVCCVISIYAQQQSPNSLDDVYTPKGNNPLSKDFNQGKASPDKSSTNYDYPRHTIKFNVGLIPRGAAVFNYEFNIKEVVSIIGIGGINFWKDYPYAAIGSPLFFDSDLGGQVLNLSNLYQKSEFSGTTPYLGGGIKFLFDADEWTKYLQVDYVTCHNNLLFNSSQLGYNVTTTLPVQFKFNISTIKYGFIYVSHFNKIKITHEFYTVIGARFIEYTPIYQSFDPITNDPSLYVGPDKKSFAFYSGFGYIIGLGFK